MGGRGAKSSLGAMGGATLTPQQQTQPQVDDTQIAQPFDNAYNNFMALTDDEKADVITQAIKQGLPAHLNDQSDFQKFLYNANGGINDKPDVVDDAILDTMTGTERFRNVNGNYNSRKDIGYTADQMVKQVQGGRYTYVSSGHTAVYGSGIYFADDYSESGGYGHTRGNIKATAVMRAKLNSNAKIITYSDAKSGASREINNNTKLGKALRSCDSESRPSIYAMSRGFNVISANNGTGYYNILNRNAITMSKDIKAKGSHW
jgi:hypothetical protein